MLHIPSDFIPWLDALSICPIGLTPLLSCPRSGVSLQFYSCILFESAIRNWLRAISSIYSWRGRKAPTKRADLPVVPDRLQVVDSEDEEEAQPLQHGLVPIVTRIPKLKPAASGWPPFRPLNSKRKANPQAGDDESKDLTRRSARLSKRPKKVRSCDEIEPQLRVQ